MQKILGPIPHFQTHCCFHFGMNSSTIWPPAVILQSLLVPEVTPGTWSNMLNLHTLAPSPSQCLKQPALSVLHHIHLIYLPPWNFRASPSQSEQQRICTTQCCWRWIQMCSMCSICSMSSSSRWWFSAPIQGTGGLRDVPDPWPSNTVLSSLQLATTHKQTSILRHTEHILILRSEWFFSWWLCHVALDQRKTGRDSSGTLPLTELFGSGRRVAPVVSMQNPEIQPLGNPCNQTWRYMKSKFEKIPSYNTKHI